MELTHEDFQLFDREYFSFKQLKTIYSVEELEALKQNYQTHWQKWKAIQQAVAESLPKEYRMAKPKVESWTNGWNLRSHFWSAYRDPNQQNQNACLAVLLNQKQFQVYMMFQHYKSTERKGDLAAYNQLLARLPAWSKNVDLTDYYIWPQVEHELADHLPLKTFLTEDPQGEQLTQRLEGRSFQIGRLIDQSTIPNPVEVIRQTFQELAPLYFALED